MNNLRFTIFSFTLFTLFNVTARTAPVRDSSWPLLLVDKTQIAKNDGVSLTLCEAVKHPDNPLIRLGGKGSVDEKRCQFDGSVYYLDGKFKMWYWAMPGGFAYAESDDGIHWTKPDLGLVEFKGNKHNNLVPMPGRPMIHYDPADPDPQRRYKKAVGTPNPNAGGRESLWTIATSPDGFHWNTMEQPKPVKNWKDGESETLTRIGDEWIIYTQAIGKYGRTVMAYHSKDIDKPVSEWEGQPVWTMKDKYPTYETHHAIKPWVRPGLQIGVFGVFQNRYELRDTKVELSFVLSHNGLDWREPWPLHTLVRRGPPGSWDSMFLMHGYPCFVNVRDKTYLYYSGNTTGNIGDDMQTGLAMLRRDGFGYVGIKIGWSLGKPAPRKGNFTSVPVRILDRKKDRVLLNVENLSADKKQFVKVELLNAKGKPVPGYTLADADPVTTNGIAVPATWQGKSSLENLTDKTIQLRIYLTGGKYRRESPFLYAVYFREPPEIEQ